jgi:hypothetical protein
MALALLLRVPQSDYGASSSPSEKWRSLDHNAAAEEWRLRADVQVGEGTSVCAL